MNSDGQSQHYFTLFHNIMVLKKDIMMGFLEMERENREKMSIADFRRHRGAADCYLGLP